MRYLSFSRFCLVGFDYSPKIGVYWAFQFFVFSYLFCISCVTLMNLVLDLDNEKVFIIMYVRWMKGK